MSTSSIGRDEERKPLLDAYLLERRILLGCSALVAVALIFWIIAISTDHWSIISGDGGIYMPETRRYFLWSHAGIWEICRYSMTPVPLLNATVGRNFTTLAYQNSSLVTSDKQKLSKDQYFDEFLDRELTYPIREIDENIRRKLFGYWIKNDTTEFRRVKAAFKELYAGRYNITPSEAKPIAVNPLNSTNLRHIFGNNITTITVNGTTFDIVLPSLLRDALFNEWEKRTDILPLLWAYSRELDIPVTIWNERRTLLQLTPPKPPRKGRIANGYEYIPYKRCKLIEMFPTQYAILNDPSIDEEILDLIRTQASFAVITVMIMVMGVVFSIYTFMNPRYMFKRLAGGIHFISAAASVVVIQVMIAALDYQQEHITFSYPAGAELTYGYGMFLAWFVFASNLVAGLMFMWYSKKKKGNKAPTDEIAMADEPINIGR